MPMHVGGLQLFEKPEGAGRNYTREMYESMRDVEEMRPLYLKHPHRSIRDGRRTSTHVASRESTHIAPTAAGVRSCKALCGRTRL